MKDSQKSRILVIEDDDHIEEGLKLNLTFQGYDVAVAANGVDGLRQWKAWSPNLIVLDIMLPGIDGLSILRNIRLEDERIPILILSARASVEDRVKGLEYGVDDYLVKPFDLDEFLLRIERLLTRGTWYDNMAETRDARFASVSDSYTFGSNRVDFKRAVARCRKGEIHLTEQEVKLLKLFVLSRGVPLSRKKLLEIGWGYSRGTATRTVDNFIVRFRKYFEDDPKKPIFFKSVRSVGYVFDHK